MPRGFALVNHWVYLIIMPVRFILEEAVDSSIDELLNLGYKAEWDDTTVVRMFRKLLNNAIHFAIFDTRINKVYMYHIPIK
jgi:hypothetical protein